MQVSHCSGVLMRESDALEVGQQGADEIDPEVVTSVAGEGADGPGGIIEGAKVSQEAFLKEARTGNDGDDPGACPRSEPFASLMFCPENVQ
jgi:hypothetical protein